MRPIYLKMSAFGPYAGETEIPMDELGTQGLYLITGDTGAGKTTIFDAICFALFGEASGANRDSGMLRSKYADDDTPTEVELYFTHGGKEYRVKRNPEYMRQAKRGSGLKKQLPDAELHMPDGKVVTKVKDVNNAIKDILGVDKEQFSQIVMLAQGDFLKLLMADTKSRIEIFREIFKTQSYMTLQKKLESEQKAVYEQVEDGKKSINQYIAGIQADKDDVLSIEVEKAIAGSMPTDDVIELLDKLTDQDTALKDKLDEELAGINNSLENVNAKIGAAEALAKAKEALEKAKKKLEIEEPKIPALESAFKEAKAALKDKTKLEKDSAKIEAELSGYDAADKISGEIEEAKQTKKKYASKLEKLEDQKGKKENELKGLKEEQTSLKDTGEELAKLNARIEKINEEAEAIDEFSEALEAYRNECDELKEKQEKYKKKDAAFMELNDLYESMEQLFRDGQAGILAEKLKDGDRCPVCGSTTHPMLAKRSESVPSEKDLKGAKQKADKARKERETSASDAGALKKSLETKEAQLTKQAKKIVKEEDLDKAWDKLDEIIDDCVSRREDVETAIKEVKEKNKRKEELENLIPASEKAIKEYAEQLEEIKGAISANDSALKEKEKNLETLLKGLSYAGKKEAEAEKKSLDKKAADIQKSYEKADAALKEQKEVVLKLKAEAESQEKTIKGSKVIDIEEVKEKQAELNNSQKECINKGKSVASRIEVNEGIRKNIIKKSSNVASIEKKLQWMRALSDTANGKLSGKDKIMLETYIQMTYFDRIINRANLRLMTMSAGQYELVRMKEAANVKSQSGLDLGVIDHYNGSERSVKTLSGGESFMASLSLALGLSDEIQSSAGGIQVDTMFVDEGFGSLDPEALDQAYRALAGLTEGNRLVGIISHVADLKELIDRQVVVTKNKSGGSAIRINV